MIQGHDGIRDAYRDADVAANYVRNRFREPLGETLHKRQVARLRELIAERRPERVLEIAPGPARLTVDLAAFFSRPGTLVDASAQMLNEARAALTAGGHPSWRLIQGDAFQLPIAGTFDLIYSFRLIRHFRDADRLRLYEQFARLLRPGGLLVFDAINAVAAQPIRETSHGAGQHYDALLTREQLDAEVSQAGFRVIQLDDVQRRFPALFRIQVLVAPRSRRLASLAMRAVESLPGGQPLEWIVTCERR
jgi:ubiquinone/menaquinone biosynthesis C-methylase UbiE